MIQGILTVHPRCGPNLKKNRNIDSWIEIFTFGSFSVQVKYTNDVLGHDGIAVI